MQLLFDIIKNFLEAEIFNLSSIKPKKKIKNEVIKNIIKFLLFLNIISLKIKSGLLNINKNILLDLKKLLTTS